MRSEEIRIRDPFILPVGGTYYLYGTTDRNCWSGPAEGFLAYSGTDLVHWDGPYPVFRPPAGFWANENFWAPEVHVYNGRFFMFASFFRQGRPRATQILVSGSPLGPFLPLADGPVTPPDWECLDGTLHVEGGTPYLVFSHEWTQVRDGEIHAMALTPDLTRAASEPVLLFRASEAPWTSPQNWNDKTAYGDYVTDGPFLYRTREGSLLMTWSSLSSTGYAVGIARSVSGSILGPWVQQEEPLFRQDGGHGMVFQTTDDRLFMALHQPNGPPGEERPKFFELVENRGSLEVRP